jgi:hypothetical protein
MDVFSIESLKVYETPPLILRALQLAQDWLTWQVDNTDDVHALPGRTWSIDYARCGRLFAFWKEEGTPNVYLVAIDPEIQTLAHPLQSSLAWFAVIPWTIRKKAGANQIELTFDTYAYNDEITFPRVRLLLHGYPPVLGVIDALAELRAKGQPRKLYCAVGNAQGVPLRGWPISE